MRLRERFVLCECVLGSLFHSGEGDIRRQQVEEPKEVVGLCHLGIGCRIIWVKLDGLIQVIDALVQIEIIEIGTSAKIQFVRCRIYLPVVGGAYRKLRVQLGSDLLCTRSSDLILQNEDIAHWTLVTVRPKMLPRGSC